MGDRGGDEAPPRRPIGGPAAGTSSAPVTHRRHPPAGRGPHARAPSLEADIAAAAMGLDDLGHSRVLYGCLEPLGADPRSPLRESDPANLSNLAYFDEPWTEWSEFVAANAVLDTAFTAMIEACVGGSVEVLQHRLRKMLMEERYHFLHGRSWLRSGIDTAPLERAWQEAIEWFGPPDGETAALHSDGKLSMGPAELRARLEEQLETKAPKTAIEWKAWDPIRRRSRGGAIDQHTLPMLRGLGEEKYPPPGAAKQAAPPA